MFINKYVLSMFVASSSLIVTLLNSVRKILLKYNTTRLIKHKTMLRTNNILYPEATDLPTQKDHY